MKLLAWNVAGLRAMIKKGNLLDLLKDQQYDIVLLQETKAEEHEVKLPEELENMYPYRFWQSTKGTTQRKGLSGTAIWSKTAPLYQINPPPSDEEGRITTIEFEEFIVVSVYTPNSQKLDTERFRVRTSIWHENFKKYLEILKQRKPTIIAGDLNVAHQDIDIHSPDKHRNKYAGFLDLERIQLTEYLNIGFRDAYRELFPTIAEKYTYWNQLNPKIRENNSGWRIDYFLVTPEIKIKECDMLSHIRGSDHCPIYLEIG